MLATTLIGDNIKPILITAAVAAGGFLLYKSYQASQREKGQKGLDNSPEAIQANELLSLLHPYSYKNSILQGSPFDFALVVMDKVANVDEEKVIKVGTRIKNFNKVREYYTALTGGRLNLVDDIRLILNASEQKRFYDNIEIAKAQGEETVKKPFQLKAAPTNSTQVTSTYDDPALKKPLFGYKPGTVLGTALKKVSVAQRAANGSIGKIYLYYISGSVGSIKGRNVYVLATQVAEVKK